MPIRHKFLPVLWLVLSAASLTVAISHARTTDFPNQPIELVVVYQVSGANDMVARVLAERMSATIGQPVVVLNKPGASGAQGAQFVANSPPDGHTVPIGGMPLVVARAMYKTPPVDFEKNLAPVGKAVRLSIVLVARKEFPVQTFAETMALERKKTGTVSMAVAASTYEFYHARINKLAQVDILKVPCSGVPAAMQDLNGNRVDLLSTRWPHRGPSSRAARPSRWRCSATGGCRTSLSPRC
ncbi:Tripartite tricarboxylate transporter family receptor [compost metagenome]